MADEDPVDVRRAKLAALGALVPGVAHDIKTPLGSIKSSADIADRAASKIAARVPEGDAKLAKFSKMLTDATSTILIAQQRIQDILRSLHAFTHEDLEKSPVDLHIGIDNTLTVIDHLLRGRITVEKNYGTLPLVECRGSEINQVVMNLLTNAARAIKGDGTITITTFTSGNGVTVEVADTGCGIAPDQLERLFEHGYTTKASGVGSGLGLSIASRIAADHGGRIEVESTEGEGATFRLILPAR